MGSKWTAGWVLVLGGNAEDELTIKLKEHGFIVFTDCPNIEDNFKVSKSDLDIRPIYVSREDRINAHVLTCFISLVILRLIQKKTDYKFTPEQIITCLKNISCSLEHENVYLFDYRSNISDVLGNTFGIDFTKRRLRLNEIKNILASSKKSELC